MKDQKVWYRKLWGNKAVEVESYDRGRGENNRIKRWDLEFTKKERVSHAGFEVSFETPHKTYNFNFYDVRHWDKDEERWLEPGEEWERFLRERAERASLEQALERINKWVKKNDLENFLNEKYETSDIQEIVSDISDNNKLDVALDLFYVLFQKKMRRND